jgi:hypothetical protein
LGAQPNVNAQFPDGQKESPIWDFILIQNVIVPLLHILLSLSNDVLSHFWDSFEERVEPLTPEEIQARNMALLAEIAVEEKEDKLKGRKEVLLAIVQERMAVNHLLKQRGLETEVRKQHLSRKASIQAKQVEARKKKMTVIFS